MALHTGMRKGEILKLRWENVNWQRKTLLLLDAKNGESRRLPIDSVLLRELSEHRGRVQKRRMGLPQLRQRRKRRTDGGREGQFWPGAERRRNHEFRFHDLRHTLASHYMMKGGQLYALSNILGHKDLKMTQRYAKLSPEYMDSQRDRMDTIWAPAPIPAPETTNQTLSKYLQ